jgi:hypothetical protein
MHVPTAYDRSKDRGHKEDLTGPDSHAGVTYTRSCADKHDMQELASLAILDEIMWNPDRVVSDYGFTGNTFSAAGPDEPLSFVYIDNAQNFIQNLGQKRSQYLNEKPEEKEGGWYARNILHEMPARWQGGFAGLEHNCHLDPALKQALLSMSDGPQFASAVKASIGNQQLAWMEDAFVHANGMKDPLIQGGIEGILGNAGVFARRYDALLGGIAKCLAA